jgi:hypothetical protein
MAESVYAGNFTGNTSTGSQSVTGVGFQSDVVIFLYNLQTTSIWRGFQAYGSFGIGMASSSSVEFCHFEQTGNTVGRHRAISDGIIFAENSSGTAIFEADFTSMDADGFTINWSTANGSAYPISFIAIKFETGTNFKIGSFDGPGTTGDHAITGVGFQPDSLFLVSPFVTAYDTSVSSELQGSYGATDGTNQWEFNGWSNGGTSDKALVSSIEILCRNQNTVGDRANFKQFDSDGFTLTYTESAASVWKHFYIATDDRWSAGTFNAPTSTGNDSVTGVGFAPVINIVGTGTKTTEDSITAEVYKHLGFTDGTNEYVVSMGRDDASGAGVGQTYHTDADMVQMYTIASGSPTTVKEATGVSLDSDGFTMNYTTADGTAYKMYYLGIPGASAKSTFFGGVGTTFFE